MDFPKKSEKFVKIAEFVDDEQWRIYADVLRESAMRFVDVVEKGELLASTESIEKSVKLQKNFVAEERRCGNEEIVNLREKRDALRNRLRDLTEDRRRTEREMRDVTCAVRACALLTNTKLVSIKNQIVGKMLNNCTGKLKYFEYASQDPELTNKLWIDVERLSASE